QTCNAFWKGFLLIRSLPVRQKHLRHSTDHIKASAAQLLATVAGSLLFTLSEYHVSAQCENSSMRKVFQQKARLLIILSQRFHQVRVAAAGGSRISQISFQC